MGICKVNHQETTDIYHIFGKVDRIMIKYRSLCCGGPFQSSEEINNIKVCTFEYFSIEEKTKLENKLNSRYFTLALNAASYSSYWSDFCIFYVIE